MIDAAAMSSKQNCFFMTDGSKMPWAERQRNALVRMSEVLNLKNQTVSRHSLQIQTALRHSLKKPSRTEGQSQTVRKALGRRNAVLSKIIYLDAN
jgi:hypothetical protein